ncbi:MAG: glycosyltransferase family 2 protein [Prevotella sp.]
MISIVIPSYNNYCLDLVVKLSEQALKIDGLQWEVIVADDASTNVKLVGENQAINQIPHCRYIQRKKNVGRARIRNFLAQEAQGEWLLFIDGDGKIISDNYLSQFVEASSRAKVCYGGYRMMPGPASNLRWLYEKASAPRHQVEKRKKNPFKSFNISNLLIERKLMLAHPLDERFVKYGYEDVMLGKELQKNNIDVLHIDSPIGFFDYESNADFVAKTEEGLQTLYRFQDELRGFSTLLRVATNLNVIPKNVLLGLYRVMKKIWRNNLTGDSPSLFVFKLYKLGYFLNLSQHAKGQ